MPPVLCVQVHHRLFVCSNAHEQKSNTQGATTVVNITPGSERLSATGLKVSGSRSCSPPPPPRCPGAPRPAPPHTQQMGCCHTRMLFCCLHASPRPAPDPQQSSAALQVTHVVSQSDVVKLLWANKAVLGDSLAQTVEQLELDDVSGGPFTLFGGGDISFWRVWGFFWRGSGWLVAYCVPPTTSTLHSPHSLCVFSRQMCTGHCVLCGSQHVHPGGLEPDGT